MIFKSVKRIMENIIFFIFEIIKFVLVIVPVLISVAYLPLAERKVLEYI